MYKRQLRRGSTRLIGIIYDNLINLYFSVMTDFIQFCLKERGYSMLTISVRSFHLNEEAYMAAVSHNVDGIISFLEPDEDVYKRQVLLLSEAGHSAIVQALKA